MRFVVSISLSQYIVSFSQRLISLIYLLDSGVNEYNTVETTKLLCYKKAGSYWIKEDFTHLKNLIVNQYTVFSCNIRCISTAHNLQYRLVICSQLIIWIDFNIRVDCCQHRVVSQICMFTFLCKLFLHTAKQMVPNTSQQEKLKRFDSMNCVFSV